MIIEHTHTTGIICDKCGKSEISIRTTANNNFYNSGWIVNSGAKKYKHLCFNCQSKRQKKANKFIRSKF